MSKEKLNNNFLDKLENLHTTGTYKLEPTQFLKVKTSAGDGNCFFHSFYKSVQSQLYNKEIDDSIDSENLEGINLLKSRVSEKLDEIFKNIKNIKNWRSNYLFIKELNEERQRKIFSQKKKSFGSGCWADHYTAFIVGIYFGIRIYLVAPILKGSDVGFRKDILNTESNKKENKSLFAGVDINSFYRSYYGQAFNELPEVFIYFDGINHFEPIYRIDDPYKTPNNSDSPTSSKTSKSSKKSNSSKTSKSPNSSDSTTSSKTPKSPNNSDSTTSSKSPNNSDSTTSSNNKTPNRPQTPIKQKNESTQSYGNLIYLLPLVLATIGAIAGSGK